MIYFSEKTLIDRSGILSKYSVFKSPNVEKLNNEEVCGCGQIIFNGTSKLYNVLNINSKGDVFLCCNDFDMKYTIGNILENPIDEIWKSEKHVNTIIDMFSNYCGNCSFRIIRKKESNLL